MEKNEVGKAVPSLPEVFLKNTVFWASRPTNALRNEFVARFCYFLTKPLGQVDVLTLPIDGRHHEYYLSRRTRDTIDREMERVAASSELIREHVRDYRNVRSFYADAIKRIGVECAGPKDILARRQDFLEAGEKLASYVWMPFVLEDKIDENFRALLIKKFGGEAERFHEIFTSPTTLNDYQRMRLVITRAAVFENEAPRLVKKLVRDFWWMSEYSFVERLYDAAYFESEIRKLSKPEALKESNNITDLINNNRLEYRKAIGKVSDDYLRNLAELFNAHAFLRTDRVDLFKKACAAYRGAISKAADYFTLTYKAPWTLNHIVHLSGSEFAAALKGDKGPDFEEANRRMNGEYVYVETESSSFVISNEKQVDKIINLVRRKTPDVSEFKGVVAYKAKVSGRVVIIGGVHEFEKMRRVEKDVVLVARSTTPEYTPFMKIAVAIITDEGGLTSHAAIVSRELRKPCIVGTKIATKVLKDGDVVEVNANDGIVKIIKKNHES